MRADLNNFIKKYWLFIFFLILVLFMVFFRISLADIWTAISSLQLWQFALLLSVYLLISLFQILTRKYLLYALLSPSRFKKLVLIHFSSMAAHYSTPAKLGFPLTVYLLKRLEHIPYATGTAVVLIELAVSMGICGLVAIFGSYFYFAEKTRLLPFFLLFIVGILIFFGVGLIVRRKKVNNRLYRFIEDTYEAFRRLDMRNALAYILIRFFIQIVSSINLMLLARFFSADLSLWQAVVAASTAFFLGALSMVPMGLGVREASVLFYLHHVGIPDELGVPIVAIQRLISTGLSFALGTIFAAFLGMKDTQADFDQG